MSRIVVKMDKTRISLGFVDSRIPPKETARLDLTRRRVIYSAAFFSCSQDLNFKPFVSGRQRCSALPAAFFAAADETGDAADAERSESEENDWTKNHSRQRSSVLSFVLLL